ncbi:MAG TPA: protein kinase [Candidatus Acidoferrum sp.]|nr:protein kinase [Candidatus Acidoferrum sp.]
MTENAQVERKCGKCGAPLAADAPEGLCPRCLMALNLATQTDAGEVGPEGTRVVPPPPEPAPPVEEIARHFPNLEILESLGRGGMGVVYKARQPRLNRFVALKILAREKERDPRFAERFTREAQALARLNHPNIVTVYDFGETDGLYYLMMEYVDGMNLRQLLQTRKLAPEEALAIVPPICEALQYAHQQGIVHRDIKPENILMDKQGRVKIADFGIAKLLGADGKSRTLTAEAQIVGTPHYMAPEQVEKPAIVDHRADIFSLGVVFYEMLTGELPLGRFAPPSSKVRLDVRLDEVVLHALEKEPERRYQQASQVKTDVETITRTEGEGGNSRLGYDPVQPAVVKAVESAWRQVRGPGNGLIITALLNLVIPAILVVAALIAASTTGSAAIGVPLILPLATIVLSVVMLAAGLMMRRLAGYVLAVLGAILAILLVPGNLIGLPIGIWALVALSRREVRDAFDKGYPMPHPAPAPGSAWKLAAVVVAGVMLLCAIPIGGIMLAIAIPSFVKARRAKMVQQEMMQRQAFEQRLSRVVRRNAAQSATAEAPERGGPAPIAFDGLDWLPWRTLFEVKGDKLVTLPKARPGFNYGHNGNGRGPTLMSNIGNPNWRDYRAEFEYCVTGVDPSFNPYGLPADYHDGGIFFHVADAKENWNQCGASMYVLEVNGDGSWFLRCTYNEYSGLPVGYEYVRRDAERKLASGRGLKIDRERGNKYVVEVIGQRIQIWVDGNQIADVTDPKMDETFGGQTLDHGGIGFSWGMDTMGWIRSVSLTQFEAGGAVPASSEAKALSTAVRRGSRAWSDGDFSKALALLLPAALKGDPVAQHRVGVMYALGQGVDQNFGEATRWFRKAAEQGQGEAQFSMGLRYHEGQGVPRNPVEAARWFKLAADQGITLAASALAGCYAKGDGVAPDLVEAYVYRVLGGEDVMPSWVTITIPELEARLTPDQLAEAERRVKEFAPKRTAPADP